MAPIRRTARTLSNVKPPIELTTIHNALQLTQLAISKIRSNSKLIFSNADLETLSSIQDTVFSLQHNVTQFSRSIGKRNSNQQQSTIPSHSVTQTDSSSDNSSNTRIVTPRRALINAIYDRPTAKTSKKSIYWYHLRHGENTDPRNCDGSCGFVSSRPTNKQKPCSPQIQNKENMVPTAAFIKSITDPAPTIIKAAIVQSIPVQTAAHPIHSTVPASQITIPSTLTQASPKNWSDICEAEENQLLADSPHPVNDILSQAMLRTELQIELESVSD